MHTCLEGFSGNVTRLDDVFMGNEVAHMFPNIYCKDLLAVYGTYPVLLLHKNSDEERIEASDEGLDIYQNSSISSS